MTDHWRDPARAAEYKRAYYRANCAKIKARSCLRYVANRERILAQSRVARAMQPDLFRARERAYAKTRRSFKAEYDRGYRAANYERLLAQKRGYWAAKRDEIAARRRMSRKKAIADGFDPTRNH